MINTRYDLARISIASFVKTTLIQVECELTTNFSIIIVGTSFLTWVQAIIKKKKKLSQFANHTCLSTNVENRRTKK